MGYSVAGRHFRYEARDGSGAVFGCYGIIDHEAEGEGTRKTIFLADARGFRTVTRGQVEAMHSATGVKFPRKCIA